MRALAGALLAAALPARGEPADADHCLTPAQRQELARRVTEAVAIMVLQERRSRDAIPLQAAVVHERTKRALAECEAGRPKDLCEGVRSAARAAANALAAARAEDRASFGREMTGRVAARAREIRAGFPSCGKAAR